MRNVLIITGLVSVIGATGTLLFSSSCDGTCSGEEQASVLVRFAGPDGASVEADKVDFVRFGLLSGDPEMGPDTLSTPPQMTSVACADRPCTSWNAGIEQEGVLKVEASYCGHVQTATMRVNLDEDGCHVDTQNLTFAVNEAMCDSEPREDELPVGTQPTCDRVAHPSVFVYVARNYEDFLVGQPVERLWWKHHSPDGEEHRGEGICAHPTENKDGCIAWYVGWELEGNFDVFTEMCETEVNTTVRVSKTKGACHVDTQFVVLEPSTGGCLTAKPAPPPPGWPFPDENMTSRP